MSKHEDCFKWMERIYLSDRQFKPVEKAFSQGDFEVMYRTLLASWYSKNNASCPLSLLEVSKLAGGIGYQWGDDFSLHSLSVCDESEEHNHLYFFYPSGGIEAAYTESKDGSAQRFEWDSSGIIRQVGNWLNDVEHGLWVDFWPNGNPKTVRFYNNGYLEGIALAYGLDGTIAKYHNFRRGCLHGLQLYLDSDGTTSLVRFFFQGEKQWEKSV